eukprot:TRINITY_DN5644_c0_g1_i3.p1 TRINITY_DN5644_c0_g1~~TRINITY_DN5644_c0_g1_i3.p1  ORF type:complete len:153 (+),score=26.96 TRINITY_DN5644_c0_g1_i3:723-1181(+)
MEHLTEFVEKPVDGGLYFAVGEHCYKCNGPPQDEDDILVSEDNWPVPYWSAMSVAALRQELRRVLLQDEFGLACLNNRDPERPSQADNDKLTSQLNIFVDNLSRAAKMCGTSFLWVAHNSRNQDCLCRSESFVVVGPKYVLCFWLMLQRYYG